MILTRDSNKNSMLCIWNIDDDAAFSVDSEGIWNCGLVSETIFYPKEFKQLFPGEKLPRKGSKQYISHLKIVRG